MRINCTAEKLIDIRLIKSFLTTTFILLLLFLQAAYAQSSTPPWVEKTNKQSVDSTQQNDSLDKEYRLAPDDLVTVNVWRHPEISTSSNLGPGALGTALLVSTDGYISFPFTGRIHVAGMTLEEFRLRILDSLKGIYKNPIVTVGLGQRRKYRLYVLGEVKAPGLYDMEKPELTIAESLTLAGGPSTKAAVNRASLQRGSEVIPLDLSGLIYRAEAGPAIMLRPEDQIIIPEMRKKVAVIGAVKTPGVYEIRDEHTLFHVIAMAGGFSERAKPNQVAIIRHIDGKNKAISINTRDIFSGAADPEKAKNESAQKQALAKNIQLEDRDIVYVPQLNNIKWEEIYQLPIFLRYFNIFYQP